MGQLSVDTFAALNLLYFSIGFAQLKGSNRPGRLFSTIRPVVTGWVRIYW